MPQSGPSPEARPAGRQTASHPSVLFNALLKSASSYITDMLIRGLNSRRTFVTVGIFPGDLILLPALQAFARGGAVAQQHFPASPENIAYLRRFDMPVVVHARDPRAVLLSWTHHLASAPGGIDELFWYYPAICPPASFLSRPFAWQLDFCLEHHLRIFGEWLEGWRMAAASGVIDPLFTTFEHFLADRGGFFAAVLAKTGIDPRHFSDPRTPPTESQLFRRGRVDEWRSVMDARQARAATDMIPGALWQTFGWTP